MGGRLRWLAIWVVFGLAATACGGSDDPPVRVDESAAGQSAASGTQTSATPTERAGELTAILLESMSDGTAVEALLFAVDAGYSADQIDAGIRQGGLDEDGLITLSGEAYAPAPGQVWQVVLPDGRHCAKHQQTQLDLSRADSQPFTHFEV